MLCVVPQDSILDTLLFLIDVNNMPRAVKSSLFLYAQDLCLMDQHRYVEEIEKQLTRILKNLRLGL